MHHLHLPPTITDIPTLFHKVHINTMLTVNRCCYLIQAHYALFSWPEWSYLQKENEKTLRDFIFEDILCQWGGVDSGPTCMSAGMLGGPIYFIPVGWITHSGPTYMSAGTLGACIDFIPVGWIACSRPTYMSAGTLGAPIYFIVVGWIAHSGPTYMLAGMLGVPIYL